MNVCNMGIGKLNEVQVTFFLPESLLIVAVERLSTYKAGDVQSIKIGCQGVFREDIVKGGELWCFYN